MSENRSLRTKLRALPTVRDQRDEKNSTKDTKEVGSTQTTTTKCGIMSVRRRKTFLGRGSNHLFQTLCGMKIVNYLSEQALWRSLVLMIKADSVLIHCLIREVLL